MSALKIVLYKNKVLTNGENPIRLRVYFGKERYISLGMSAKPSEWNDKTGRYSSKAPNYESRNALLRNLLARAEELLTAIIQSGKPFSIHDFKAKFQGNDKKVTVLDFLDQRVKELITEKRIGNSNKYKQLASILQQYKTGEYLFSDVDYSFLKGFESFLLARGSKKSNVHFYMRTFRALVNEAIRRELLDAEEYPFATQFNKNKYSFSHLKNDYDPKPLPMDELERLKSFPVHQYPHLQNSYDIFIFLLRARGLNFVDLCNLTVDNLVAGRLNYIRQKTGKLYSIKITPEMRDIVNKYLGEVYLFPIMDDAPTKASARYWHVRNALRYFNRDLKEISEIMGLKKKMTSYTARYTYTNVLVQNNVPVPKISQALGHSSIATTQHYIMKFANEEVDKVDMLI
jgi:integrase/recombinase XerD